MQIDLHNGLAGEWSERHFGGIDLGDPRRNKRAVKIAEALAKKSGTSIPALFERSYDVKATYSFFDVDKVKPENLQMNHQNLVKTELDKSGEYLLIEDSSEFNWSDAVKREGLGEMHEKQQGFILHTVLAVKWHEANSLPKKREACELIGLVYQEYYPRVSHPANEANEASYNRKQRERESQLWQRSGQSLDNAPSQKNIRWVRVADRGADIAFFLQDCLECGHGFVVRAAQNRVLINAEGQREALKLFEKSRKQVSLGQFELNLRKRPKQVAREVRLSLSSTDVQLRHPDTQEAIKCSVIRVWEAKPPQGVKALEWILLTDKPSESFENVLKVALQYSSRWLIEEYHKCLKTGLKADELQLQTAHRLFAAIALMAVVAVRLLALKEHLRLQPDASAQAAGLNDLELQVLSLSLNRQLHTVKDVALALGRLGGHMNRKRDGLPGWQTLWKGRRQLDLLITGFKLAQHP